MGDEQSQMEWGNRQEVATLAGGCFWCLEAVFDELEGIEHVVPGYSGGTVPDPSYSEVCAGRTGHAEAVQVTFDPEMISFREILEVFFSIHNPTTVNRQGMDVGTQYRSAIFYHNEEQKLIAESIIREYNNEKIWGAPIVTEVTPFESFYPAEHYHQRYFKRNRGQPYCEFVIAPKVTKLRNEHVKKLKIRRNG